MSPEMPYVLSFTVVLYNIVRSIAIRHIDISGRGHGRFRGFEGLLVLVDPDGAGMSDSKQQPSVQVGLYHLPRLAFPGSRPLLVPATFRDQQKSFSSFLADGEALS